MKLIEELAQFIASNPDPRELKRALAIKMTLQGYTHAEIMNLLQVSSGFISKWKLIFIDKGLPGLTLGYRGLKPYLSAEQRQSVIEWIKQQKNCNPSLLEHYIDQAYEVTFASSQSYYTLLHEAGLSWKKVQKTNPQKDLEAVTSKKKRLAKS